jgi:hypothetical protein
MDRCSPGKITERENINIPKQLPLSKDCREQPAGVNRRSKIEQAGNSIVEDFDGW